MAFTRDGRIGSHSHAKPRIKPTGMLASILSATYCWFSRDIPLAWPSIQVNLIYVLKFYSIDCTLDSPGFGFSLRAQPPRAIRDIFHRDVRFPSGRRGWDRLWREGNVTDRYIYRFPSGNYIFVRNSVNVLTKQILLRYSSWLSMHIHYAIVWKTKRNIFIEIHVTWRKRRLNHRLDWYLQWRSCKRNIYIYTVWHTSSVASLHRGYRDDGMRTARRGWRERKNFLDARSSPKKFTVRKALGECTYIAGDEGRIRISFSLQPSLRSSPLRLPCFHSSNLSL